MKLEKKCPEGNGHLNKKKEQIELDGEIFESFERVEGIKEIVLLGKKGGVRRIIIE